MYKIVDSWLNTRKTQTSELLHKNCLIYELIFFMKYINICQKSQDFLHSTFCQFLPTSFLRDHNLYKYWWCQPLDILGDPLHWHLGGVFKLLGYTLHSHIITGTNNIALHWKLVNLAQCSLFVPESLKRKVSCGFTYF